MENHKFYHWAKKKIGVQSTFKTEQEGKISDPKKISDGFMTFFCSILDLN